MTSFLESNSGRGPEEQDPDSIMSILTDDDDEYNSIMVPGAINVSGGLSSGGRAIATSNAVNTTTATNTTSTVTVDIESNSSGNLPIAAELAETEDERLETKLQERLEAEGQNHVIAEAVIKNNEKGDDEDEEEVYQKRLRTGIIGSIILSILIGIIVGVVLGLNRSDQRNGNTLDDTGNIAVAATEIPSNHPTGFPTITPSPTAFPTPSPTAFPPQTPAFEELYQLIANDITQDVQVLRTVGTPQYKALEWLANSDPAGYGFLDSALKEILIERYSLVLFYFVTNGDSWDDTMAFLGSQHVCNWFDGLACDDNQSVTQLEIVRNSLQGYIPTEIGLLTNLWYLDLGSNFLTGTIPTEIFTQLQGLFYLYLDTNLLTGSIPTQFGSMPFLLPIYTPANSFSGTIPTEIGNASLLTAFTIAGDVEGTVIGNIEGTIPTQIGELTSLEEFSITSSKLVGTIPTEIGLMSKAVLVSIYENLVSGPIPSEIGNLDRLSSLSSGDNQLTGTVPTELQRLSNLQLLILAGNELVGDLDPLFCENQAINFPQLQFILADCYDVPPEISCSCCELCY